MNTQFRTAIGVLGVMTVGLAVLTACSGDQPDPIASGSATSTTSPEPDEAAWTRAELATALFDGDAGTSSVLGAADGAVPDRATPKPARVEVTEVHAGQETTFVRFTLLNVDSSTPLLSLDAFNTKTPLTRDIRDVALVDSAQNTRLQPYLANLAAGESNVSFCTCATAPVQMSTVGQLLSATFPALDPATTTVALELPGFGLIENLPVTRD